MRGLRSLFERFQLATTRDRPIHSRVDLPGAGTCVFSRQCGLLPADAVPRSEADLRRLGEDYFAYVRRRLAIVRVRRSDQIALAVAGIPLLCFVLDDVAVGPMSRVRYRITGGLLDALTPSHGYLSLTVEAMDGGGARLCVLVSDYQPRLSGPVGDLLYRFVQTPIHTWLGHGFVRWARSGRDATGSHHAD